MIPEGATEMNKTGYGVLRKIHISSCSVDIHRNPDQIRRHFPELLRTR